MSIKEYIINAGINIANNQYFQYFINHTITQALFDIAVIYLAGKIIRSIHKILFK
jgi:hypothetical protein